MKAPNPFCMVRARDSGRARRYRKRGAAFRPLPAGNARVTGAGWKIIVARMERGGLKAHRRCRPAGAARALSQPPHRALRSRARPASMPPRSPISKAWCSARGSRSMARPRGFAAWLRDFLLGRVEPGGARRIWLDICIGAVRDGRGHRWSAGCSWRATRHGITASSPAGRARSACRRASREQIAFHPPRPRKAPPACRASPPICSATIRPSASSPSRVGFAFGIPSLLLLVHNMALLGALLWAVRMARGCWLTWPHGTQRAWHHRTFTRPFVLSGGAAGLHIGRSMAFPGNRPVLIAAAEAGKRGAVVMVGVVIMIDRRRAARSLPRASWSKARGRAF